MKKMIQARLSKKLHQKSLLVTRMNHQTRNNNFKSTRSKTQQKQTSSKKTSSTSWRIRVFLAGPNYSINLPKQINPKVIKPVLLALLVQKPRKLSQISHVKDKVRLSKRTEIWSFARIPWCATLTNFSRNGHWWETLLCRLLRAKPNKSNKNKLTKVMGSRVNQTHRKLSKS